MKCGIIGLPNVGKSTIFNLLCDKDVKAQNYPFCTVDPNIAYAEIEDERVNILSKINKSINTVSARIKFVDIAGIIEGAHHGSGLGSKFLDNIRQVDVICHVVRCFQGDGIVHVYDDVNPVRDIELVETELTLKDIQTVEKYIQTTKKNRILGESVKLVYLQYLNTVLHNLENSQVLHRSKNCEDLLQEMQLFATKPVLYICSVDDSSIAEERVTVVRKKCSNVMKICAFSSDKQSLNELVQHCFHLLNLGLYFTSGAKETKAWTFTQGVNAEQCAGKIHTDLSRGFICAEVIPYSHYIEHGCNSVNSQGIQKRGRKYVMQDGDVVLFRFNVNKSKKKT